MANAKIMFSLCDFRDFEIRPNAVAGQLEEEGAGQLIEPL